MYMYFCAYKLYKAPHNANYVINKQRFEEGKCIMAKGLLTEEEINILEENPYVQDVSESRIIYTNKFKFHFMKEYLAGKKPTQIFVEAGFDTKILGSKRIERAAYRWRKSYETGGLGAYRDAKIHKRRCPESEEMTYNLTYEECIRIMKKQQDEIVRLRAENAILLEEK